MKLPITKEAYKRLETTISASFSSSTKDYDKQVKKLKQKLEKLTFGQYTILTTAMMELVEPIIKKRKK